MPESPSSSFIPKRGVGKKPTVVRKTNFVLLSIISYALFVSAPLASAAVFIYERHTQNQFDKAVVNLDEAISNFKEEDLKRVTAFNDRLALTKKLLASHVSVENLLRNIEAATAQTVRYKDLDVTRIDSSKLEVSGLLLTDKFDGALFQRASYNSADSLTDPVFKDVKLTEPVAQADDTKTSTAKKVVEFKATFSVPVSAITYKPIAQVLEALPEAAAVQTETSMTSTSDDETDI